MTVITSRAVLEVLIQFPNLAADDVKRILAAGAPLIVAAALRDFAEVDRACFDCAVKAHWDANHLDPDGAP